MCVSSASTGLCGGCRVTGIPTAALPQWTYNVSARHKPARGPAANQAADQGSAPPVISQFSNTGFTIARFGGSDTSSGPRRLAEDPEVEVTIVITDGVIEFPAEPMPCGGLWVLGQTARSIRITGSFADRYPVIF